MESNVLELILDGRSEPTNIRLTLLENITGNFAEEREIGQGGTSTVYKGVLRNGEVVVKRLMNTRTINEKLLYDCVNRMFGFNHKNIVRLLGYCDNTEKKVIKIQGSEERVYADIREIILCFEYMSDGALHNHITDELRGLEWHTRYKIIKEICDGLQYLHEEKEIIHLDVKPSNILVDNHMLPKFKNFGLLMVDEDPNVTILSSPPMEGPYCAPEYRNGVASYKSDIYSLGVIIIEVVTGSKGFPNKNNVLKRWRHRWRKSGKGTPLEYQQITMCIKIGMLCQEYDPSKRPVIWDIIRDINKMDVGNGQRSNVDEQIIPYLGDDMLGIEPIELHFPFELNKQISSSLELTNETGAYIAFNIQATSPLKYHIEPKKGIILPRSKYSVKITLESQEKAPRSMKYAYAFILQSTKVTDGFVVEDITAEIYNERTGNVVDEVNLDVVLDTQSQILDVHKMEVLFPFKHDNLTPMVLPLELLKAITYDFSTKSELGRGGYGVVYKGVFPSGEIIAVKKLFEIHLLNDETFQNEVSYLTGIKHRNVVQFVGYCAETSWELMPQPRGTPIWVEIPKRLICFEYVCNKSLDNYISDESTGLEWSTRYNIINGICSGLHFLHKECRMVHLDLKPENIMMDTAMMPKLTDFGLSRMFGNQETRIITDNRVGSCGYMAPEYSLQGLITTKADIFSLGVIIIQIMTGDKKYPISTTYLQFCNGNDCPDSTNDTSFELFIKEVVESWGKKFLSTTKYKPMKQYKQQVERCITIALECVHPYMDKRPTAEDIMKRISAAQQD